jgi:DNA-binding MarR family transcriptional regulator
MPYISGELRTATTELAMDPAREIWELFLDPILDLLKSHVLAHYSEHRLTSSQACLLQRLNHPMPQREAALQLGYDPSNITALADVLEAKGLVERRLDLADRRVKTLARTAEGERLARALDESLSQPPESLNRLSPDEQQQLLRLLSKAFGPKQLIGP